MEVHPGRSHSHAAHSLDLTEYPFHFSKNCGSIYVQPMEPLSLEQQFLKAYDAFADAIFRHCYLRVFDRERAKDFMQETFTRAWAYLAEGKEVKNIRAFLYQVATNLIIDESRKKKAASLNTMQEEGFDVLGEDGRTDWGSRMDAKRILPFLNQIDASYREVVALRYLDGLSPKEIAEIVGDSENTVSVRIHRGVKKLKLLLQHE